MNFNHDVGFVEEATTNKNKLYYDVLKKNIKASQVNSGGEQRREELRKQISSTKKLSKLDKEILRKLRF